MRQCLSIGRKRTSDFVGILVRLYLEKKNHPKPTAVEEPFLLSGRSVQAKSVYFAYFLLKVCRCVSNESLSFCSLGQSNPTFYLEKDGQAYVLRKKPHGPLLPGAHRVSNTLLHARNGLYCGGPSPVCGGAAHR